MPRRREGSNETETRSHIIFVLVDDVNSPDRRAGERVSQFRDGAPVEYLSAHQIPENPPPGRTEVFMSTGLTPRFRSRQHQENWKGVSFWRLVNVPGVDWPGISSEPKKAADFEVLEG
jgi:hypothetical protein